MSPSSGKDEKRLRDIAGTLRVVGTGLGRVDFRVGSGDSPTAVMFFLDLLIRVILVRVLSGVKYRSLPFDPTGTLVLSDDSGAVFAVELVEDGRGGLGAKVFGEFSSKISTRAALDDTSIRDSS